MAKPERGAIVIFDAEPLKALHLSKDVGLLPSSIAEKTGRDSLLIAIKGSDRTRPPLVAGMAKVDLRLVPQRFGKKKGLASYVYALNAFSVGMALAAEARSSRLLLIFHAHPALLLYALVYKCLNPTGRIWLKLDMDDGGLGDFLRKRGRFRFYLHCADIVSVETRSVQKRLNDVFGHIRRIEWVPDGYDAVGYPIDAGRLSAARRGVFLSVGRLGSRQKNNECFLEAIQALKSEGLEFRFVGESTDDFARKAVAAQAASGQPIRLLGRIEEREALFRQYEEAQAFVLTSRYESFGIVLVEAMARGCYLISTELASARDIINGDESVGLVVPQNDPAALAEALRRVSSMRIDHLSIAHKAERYYYKNIIQGLPWIPGHTERDA